MKYQISEKASEDLDYIWLYTFENWSREQADRYYNILMDEIEFVVENFESGKSIHHIRSGYKVTKAKSHLIFYRRNKKNVVEIIRILHQRIDVESRLSD